MNKTKTTNYLTQVRVKELKKELEYLKNVKHPEIAKLIKEARELGSLEDNADYDIYMDQQALIESRIRDIEVLLTTSTVITKNDNKVVSLGNRVIVEVEGRKDIFVIVGVDEAAPHEGKISHISPVGKSLLGCKVGQEVLVETEVYSTIYKIIDIEHA